MKEYISAKEIQEMTGIGYQSSMKIINKVREEMEKKNYLIPNCRKKVALKWMIKKELGIR